MSMLVAIDLDRTLFDTDSFFEDLSEHAANIVGVTKQTFIDNSANFYKTLYPNLTNYNLLDQLSSYGFYEHDLIIGGLTEKLKNQARQYLYADVGRFLMQLKDMKLDAIVLSYGVEQYQRLKIALCPELESLNAVIVLEPKYVYLQQLAKDRDGVLFDDVAQESMPANWRHILVDRKLSPNNALIDALLQV